VSSEITENLRLEVGRHCFGFFSSQNSDFRKLLKYGYKYYFKVLVFFPDWSITKIIEFGSRMNFSSSERKATHGKYAKVQIPKNHFLGSIFYFWKM
jgi:hypothetical protein